MDSTDRHDAATVEVIYSAHAETLVRLASSLVGPGSAEDLVATAVAKCLRARDWNYLDDPAGHLYRAVLNESQSVFRKTAVRARGYRATIFGRAAEPDHAGATSEAIAVRAALARLSPRQRAVVVLTYWEDRPPSDVAELFGISEGSVKKHLARARASLRKELQ